MKHYQVFKSPLIINAPTEVLKLVAATLPIVLVKTCETQNETLDRVFKYSTMIATCFIGLLMKTAVVD